MTKENLYRGLRRAGIVLGVVSLTACAGVLTAPVGADFCGVNSCLYPYKAGMEKLPDPSGWRWDPAQDPRIARFDDRCSTDVCIWLPRGALDDHPEFVHLEGRTRKTDNKPIPLF